MSPKKVSVDVFEVGGEIKVITQFDLNGLNLKKDEFGRLSDEAKLELQSALKEALMKWSFE